MSSKKIHGHDVIGQQGVNLIEKYVLEMGNMWYPTGGIEAGIDGIIEIRDPNTGEVLNSIIQVQSKATSVDFQAETKISFEYLCKEKDLNYWLQGNAPVVLIVSRPITNEAYWVSIKDYFRELDKRKSRKVTFIKDRDRFDETCWEKLAQLAIPKDAGIYISPPPQEEILFSNLLEVSSFTPQLFIAETGYRSYKKMWDKLRRYKTNIGSAWILKEKRIYSFHNLEDYPWHDVCDLGTLEVFETDEWAFSDDLNRRREFVQLLNLALKDKLWPTVRYSERNECYYFSATRDLSSRKIYYKSQSGRKTPRTVFKGYANKRDPSKIAYYRHSAFEAQFRLFDEAWFLEITPTYFFTWDGYKVDRWYEDRLKTIKRLERNLAVFGQVVMWADYLSKPRDMFAKQESYIQFGSLKQFEIVFGVDDKSWLQSETEDEAEKVRNSLKQLPLFKI